MSNLDEIEVCPFCGREKAEWISVKNGLPEKRGPYLAYAVGEYSFIDVVVYYPHLKKWNCGYEVTHWMPLPETPKGE